MSPVVFSDVAQQKSREQRIRSDAADVTTRRPSFSGGTMRHPALRRSARHSSKREARAEAAKAAGTPDGSTPPADHDPAAQNRVAPGAPPDGEHNQGGVRREGMDYQRDLGSEQDS
jgi:heme exporter protein D